MRRKRVAIRYSRHLMPRHGGEFHVLNVNDVSYICINVHKMQIYLMRNPSNHYLNGAVLTEELHLSKLSVATTIEDDPHLTDYDVIVPHGVDVPYAELITIGQQSRSARLKRLHEALAKQLGHRVVITERPDTVPTNSIIVRRYVDPPPINQGKPQRTHMPLYFHTRGHNAEVVLTIKADLTDPRPQMTDKLARALMLLTSKLATKSNYRNYSFRSEFESDAMLQFVHAIFKFNESKSDNIFAYASQTANNSFVRRLNIERRQRDIRDDVLEDLGAMPSHTRQQEHAERQSEAD